MPTLLVFIPHPDDDAYAFGGTMALAARAGWRIHVEVATAGEKGERHDGVPEAPETLGPLRLAELAESCQILGAESPACWGLADGGLRESPDQSPRVARIIAEQRPDLVFALGEDGAYGHPDHIAVYKWVRAGWESLGDGAPPLLLAAFPRGLFLPQYELCIGMMGNPPEPRRDLIGATEADYRVEIGDVRETKLAAIRAHRTQLPGGKAEALFPRNIVQRLLGREMFEDARGGRNGDVATLLGSLRR